MSIHDADKVIGRIRNDGGWDRRYGDRRRPLTDYRLAGGVWPRPVKEPLPELNVWRRVLEIAALTVYCLILFGSLLFIAAYFAVWMPTEVMAPR